MKSNPNSLSRTFVDPNKLSFEDFKTNILTSIDTSKDYVVSSKLKFDDDNYRMVGRQQFLSFASPDNPQEERSSLIKELSTQTFIDRSDEPLWTSKNYCNELDSLSLEELKVLKLYNHLNTKLVELYYEYGILVKNYVQITWYTNKNTLPKVIKNINPVKLEKQVVNIKQTKFNFSNKFLPLTMNESSYGKKQFSTLRNQNLNSSKYPQKRVYINEDTQLKTIVTQLDEIHFKKEVFKLETDVLVQTAYDTIIDEISFKRQIDKTTCLFSNNEMIEMRVEQKFSPLKPSKPKKNVTTPNKNIGSFDIETYVSSDGSSSKVYALGFSTEKDLNKPTTFYIDKDTKNSHDLIILCIKSMLKTKYNNFIFYCHNFGGFDSIFILKALLEYNKNNTEYKDFFKLSYIFKDCKILRLNIQAQISKSVKVKISFIDSLNLLPDSLDSLSKTFDSETKKGIFPHSFVSAETLFYIGSTPDLKYFSRKRKIIDQKEYDLYYKNHWDLKEECLTYLNDDLKSLLNIVSEFNRYIFINYNVQVTECLTISSLALKIFTHMFMKQPIPLINNQKIFKDIKQAYYGGLTEIYKPYGENLYYYDVNSLYPFVALNFMIGILGEFIETYNNSLKLEDLFGFFYCKIKTPKDDYLGLLPKKSSILYYPLGEWEGWYFSELLKFAKENGYEIEVIRGYNFDKTDKLFDTYVNHLYEIKANSSGAIKTITKYLLNSLLGRYALDILKEVSSLMDMEEYDNIRASHEIKSEKWITDLDVLVSYVSEVSEEICKESGVDYIGTLNLKNKDFESEINKFKNVSIGISAAVTAYASIFMSKIKLQILKDGGQIYYMDTDSIVTDKPLPESLISNKLGQFKLEHKIKRGYFIASKTYCIVTENPEKPVVIKSKGVFDDSLSEESFIKLYNKENIVALKGNTKKDWGLGSVTIGTKEVNLNFDSYKKRQKIYDKNGKWVDTKPLKYYDGKFLNLEQTQFVLCDFKQFILCDYKFLDYKNIFNTTKTKLYEIHHNLVEIENLLLNKPLKLVLYKPKFLSLVEYNTNIINKPTLIYSKNKRNINKAKFNINFNKDYFITFNNIIINSFNFIIKQIIETVLAISIIILIFILIVYLIDNPHLISLYIRYLLQGLSHIKFFRYYNPYSFNYLFNTKTNFIQDKPNFIKVYDFKVNFFSENLERNILSDKFIMWTIFKMDYLVVKDSLNKNKSNFSEIITVFSEDPSLSSQNTQLTLNSNFSEIITVFSEEPSSQKTPLSLNTNVGNVDSNVNPSIAIPIQYLFGRGFNSQNIDPQPTPNLALSPNSPSPTTPYDSVTGVFIEYYE